MSRENTWLLEHRRNIFSQGGEDGIVEKLLELLPETDSWCVEFGALDGRYLSNSCHLIENLGFSAVLIEADEAHYQQLQAQYAQRENVLTINRFVGFGRDDSLDAILQATDVPTNFDLLSIDIDGNDYHAWQATQAYQPKIVIIEFNPTIPTGINYVQDADPAVSKGCSLAALVALGKEKGYELVSVLKVNAIFVRSEYFSLFAIDDNSAEALRTDVSSVTQLFVGYDGEVVLLGNQTLPWHRIGIKPGDVQVLPGFLRKFPGNYSLLQKIVFAAYLAIKNPAEFLHQFRTRVLKQKP